MPGGQERSRFVRTVQYVQHSCVDDRAKFTEVALTQLIAVYMAEADLARADAAHKEPAGRGKLLGWAQAVDQYTNQLLLLLDDVEQGFPVSVRLDQQGLLTAFVADRAVILGHPRAAQQSAYEMRVLTEFCNVHDCQRMSVATSQAQPIPDADMRVAPLWNFTAGGPVCIYDAIEVQFQNTQNMPIKRGLCAALMQEIATVAVELAWQGRHGVVIDWAALAISATPGRLEHSVSLNKVGDSVLAQLPLLFSNASLLADISGWLSARTGGKTPAVIRLNADDYGWEIQ